MKFGRQFSCDLFIVYSAYSWSNFKKILNRPHTYILDVVAEILWVAERSVDVFQDVVLLAVIGETKKDLNHLVHWNLYK